MQVKQALEPGRTPIQQYQLFCARVRDKLRGERGRTSLLARYLDTHPRNVHRWFVTANRDCPGWAAIATLAWLEGRR